jgi:16S rRNA (cytosine1402-N4)-methyltransferase
VLVAEVCEALGPALRPRDGAAGPVLVDLTCGGGGHSAALLRAGRPARLLCFDRDADALACAAERLRDVACPVQMFHAPFSHLVAVLRAQGIGEVSAIVADLGVSSHQLQTPDRGFSFSSEGPLDMRMDRGTGRSAAEILATIDADELARLLRAYGEEPDARRIARAIVRARPRTTRELADVVADAMSAARRRALGRRIHPATRTFQALRILVNDELAELERLLETAPDLLVVGGRIGIISFHSLEDRRVKRAFAERARPPVLPRRAPLRARELPAPRFRIPSGWARGVVPGAKERADNPRARSARLRVLERSAA